MAIINTRVLKADGAAAPSGGLAVGTFRLRVLSGGPLKVTQGGSAVTSAALGEAANTTTRVVAPGQWDPQILTVTATATDGYLAIEPLFPGSPVGVLGVQRLT